MKKAAALFLALALASTSIVAAMPPPPCDCASCFLLPDRPCMEWFKIEFWECRDYLAAHCPVEASTHHADERTQDVCPVAPPSR